MRLPIVLLMAVAVLALAGCGVGTLAGQAGTPSSLATATATALPDPTATPTAVPTPTPTALRGRGYLDWEPVPEHMRRDLGNGVIAATDVYGDGRAVYVTHVASGSQVVIDGSGVRGEHFGIGAGGRPAIDAALSKDGAMARMQAMLDTEPTTPQCINDLNPELRFGGLTYRPTTWLSSFAAVPPELLGEVRYRTSFHLQCGWKRTLEEGETLFLPAGTPVYQMLGYATTFRLAAKGIGAGAGLWVYEASYNPDATVGEDLLDIRGKVTSIDVFARTLREPPMATMDDPALVEELVGLLLSAPVDHGDVDLDGKRYFLAFRLADGTTTVRSLHIDEGRFAGVVVAPPRVAEIVREALR